MASPVGWRELPDHWEEGSFTHLSPWMRLQGSLLLMGLDMTLAGVGTTEMGGYKCGLLFGNQDQWQG